eukprot:817561-Amphidinium_carterae.2
MMLSAVCRHPPAKVTLVSHSPGPVPLSLRLVAAWRQLVLMTEGRPAPMNPDCSQMLHSQSLLALSLDAPVLLSSLNPSETVRSRQVRPRSRGLGKATLWAEALAPP